MSQFLFLYC